jgi:alpha-tubulin suppressor-like RCC1 family protein
MFAPFMPIKYNSHYYTERVGRMMLPVITRILTEYGEDVFKNMQRTNAMLMDLAPGQNRERILVRNFIEADGYEIINRDESYPLIEQKLVEHLTDVFSLERNAALWVVRLFAAALGKITFDENGKGDSALISSHSFPYLAGQVALGKTHVVAVSAEHTVYAGGADDAFQCNVSGWQDVVAVAAGDAHTLGLKADGTVLAAGSNAYDQCDILHLKNVTGVYAFGHDSVFVFADGTATSVGRSKWDLSAFENIVSISHYPEGVIGIREDGTLQLACYTGDEDMKREQEWLLAQTDVVQVISTYINGSILLKKDGRLYKSGEPDNYFAQWRGVVSVTNVTDGFAILNDDGTVRILSYDRAKPRISTYADRWSNIKAIYGGYRRLIGLTRDSHLVSACTNLGWLWHNSAMSIDFVTDWYPVSAYYG